MSYQRLMDEHDRIDARLATLSVLAKAETPDLPAVVLGLSDLAGELERHLAHEDSFIYPRMMSGASGGASDVANAFVADFAALREDWGLYLREWTSDGIAADWAGFGQETRSMMARLADRVKAENQLLYAAALQSGVIPLRDAV
jgi:iron-sulfur cluster repair protein YtfE (RIC family)